MRGAIRRHPELHASDREGKSAERKPDEGGHQTSSGAACIVRVSQPKGNLDEDVPTGHVRWSRDEAQATWHAMRRGGRLNERRPCG